ncbi:MAG: S41 family peptidase [Chitinophagales bacterium]|nr:S41 family peptidase [Chitinophagales bacterium]
MKKNLTIATLILTLGSLTLMSSINYFEVSKNMEIFSTLYKELNTYYVDDIDPNDLMREGIDAMLSSLDPYTNFYSESEIEGYRMQTTGKYGGIGATIQRMDDRIIVAEPMENYPADKAGMKAGDIIIEVEGKVTDGMTQAEVSKLLKGQPNTKVKVTVERMQKDGSYNVMDIMIDREEIKIKNVPYYSKVDNDIAYIKLAHFTEKAGKEVQDALKELQADNTSIKGVVLDLRDNPGGLLNEAVNVSNIFVEKGEEIVFTKGRIEEWNKKFRTLNNPVDTEIPVVVLTNGGSASASEIVSGSLQDLDRGVVLGQKTFGKGLVQTTRSLTYNTKLKLTTAKYYIPSGRCIQAIDYADKDGNGKPIKRADSLKAVFQTKGGRAVFDGGGIDPDIIIKNKKYSKISVSLLSKNLIFDYATKFAVHTESIPAVEEFEISDEVFNDFVQFISDKPYDYVTNTEALLKDFKKEAQKEKYFEAVNSEFELLENKMKRDKENDIQKHKEEIKQLLREEIANRYYYTKGEIKASFKRDQELQQAITLLRDETRYTSLLRNE